ncbi:MAG: sugar ABC transporter permease [Mycoplasmatales bacterium]|nr:sugar ABC transporter permease [Mycoplasmatales bacterium]
MLKLKNRNQKNELIKFKIKSSIEKINPFSTISGRASRILLNDNVIKTIEREIKKYHENNLDRKDKKMIYYVLNNNDTREFLTIYAQELLDKKKILNREYLLSAIKVASASLVYPVKSKLIRKNVLKTQKHFFNLSVLLAKKYNSDFGEKISMILNQNDSYDNDQKIYKFKVDPLRNYLWNKYLAFARIIAEEFKKLKFEDEISNLFEDIAKYQLLFNETSAFTNNSKSDNLVKKHEYSSLSNASFDSFEKINKVLTNWKLNFRPSFLSHITESNEKLHLSDLPKLSATQFISLALSYLLLILWSVVIIFPLIQMIILSFDGTGKNKLGFTGADKGAFIHYKNLWNETDFKYWLGNSLEVAFITMLVTVVFTLLLAYAFSRFKFKGKKSSLMGVMLLQMVPSIAALTAFLVLYQMMNAGIKIQITTFLIIIYTGGAVTGNTFVLKGYMDSIPKDLDEAAEIDGASKWKTFYSILVPLAKPMIAIVALWSFIGPFGDVILPALLSDGTSEASKHLTIAAGLKTLLSSGNNGHSFEYEYLAGAIITALPIAIIFIYAQKFMVGGLTAGAVK